MKKMFLSLPEIKLVGITTRTSNADLFTQDPSANDIARTMQKYFEHKIFEKINNSKNREVTFCVYTAYENDFNGCFTYFIGQEVVSFDSVASDLEMITIPIQNYIKFTNAPGRMPDVCIDMWEKIWTMDTKDFRGQRSYIADFEVYDVRSRDQNNAVLDIYIGVKNN